MILIDTSTWVDYFNGIKNPTTALVDRILDQEPVLIGDLFQVEHFHNCPADDQILFHLLVGWSERFLPPFRNKIDWDQ